MKLPKKLNHPRKRLIIIHNIDDNNCFRMCLVRSLNPADHHWKRITKADRDFSNRLDFKGHKIFRKN